MPRIASRLKTTKQPEQADIDPSRAVRTIRILGALNLILLLLLGVSVWWGSRGADALRITATLEEHDQPVKIFMEARMTTSGGRPIRSGDTVTDPVITVHGVLSDYGRLREGLNGLSVTVRGTRVDIFPETGEFTERVVLVPGANQIDFGVWWEGRQWQKSHAEVIYKKHAESTAPTPETPLPL